MKIDSNNATLNKRLRPSPIDSHIAAIKEEAARGLARGRGRDGLLAGRRHWKINWNCLRHTR